MNITSTQRKVIGTAVSLIVAFFVFAGIRNNRRKQQQEKLRKLEEIKVERAKRRTKSVVFAKENIKARCEIKKEWLEVKEVEERDLPKQEYYVSLDAVVWKMPLCDIYMGEPIIEKRIIERDAAKAPDLFIGDSTEPYIEASKMRAIVIKVFPYDVNGAILKGFQNYSIHTVFESNEMELIKKVRVLNVEKEDDGATNGYVTFEATLAECEKLIFASTKGKLIFKRLVNK